MEKLLKQAAELLAAKIENGEYDNLEKAGWSDTTYYAMVCNQSVCIDIRDHAASVRACAEISEDTCNRLTRDAVRYAINAKEEKINALQKEIDELRKSID